MSGVHKRVVLFDDSSGVIRPLDWCRVSTGIGNMYEPRTVLFDRFDDGTAIDFTDMIVKVDAFERVDIHKPLADGTIGGDVLPRSGP